MYLDAKETLSWCTSCRVATSGYPLPVMRMEWANDTDVASVRNIAWSAYCESPLLGKYTSAASISRETSQSPTSFSTTSTQRVAESSSMPTISSPGGMRVPFHAQTSRRVR